MKEYTCILFDLDGTLANTYMGIFNSYKYAAEQMNLPLPTDKLVNEAIGAPLADVFKYKFELEKDKVRNALFYYRTRYATKGIHEVTLYPKTNDLLKILKERGYKVGVATLKNEEFAKQILNDLGLEQYLDIIVGMDEKDKLTKAEMINSAISLLGHKKENTVLVGDSIYDALGAEEIGVDFIAVTYGFGFKNSDDVKKYKHIAVVDEIFDISNIV